MFLVASAGLLLLRLTSSAKEPLVRTWLAILVRMPLTSSHLPLCCVSELATFEDLRPMFVAACVSEISVLICCELSGGRGVALLVVHSCFMIFIEVPCPFTASLTCCVGALYTSAVESCVASWLSVLKTLYTA